jgi:hypothetical protein
MLVIVIIGGHYLNPERHAEVEMTASDLESGRSDVGATSCTPTQWQIPTLVTGMSGG